jgi:hypothetical protein
MGLLDDLSKIVTDVGQTAKEKAGEIAVKSSDLVSDLAEKGKYQAELIKLKNQISSEKKLLLQAEAELGRLAYRNHMFAEDNGFVAGYEKIHIHLLRINELEMRIRQIRQESGDQVTETELIEVEIVDVAEPNQEEKP